MVECQYADGILHRRRLTGWSTMRYHAFHRCVLEDEAKNCAGMPFLSVYREQLPSIGGQTQALVEFLNRERSVGGKAWRIEFGVIDQHLTDVSLGSLRRRGLEVSSQIVESRVHRAEVGNESFPHECGRCCRPSCVVMQEYEGDVIPILGWASRHVLAWRLSNTLDAGFCTEALEEALARHGAPEIFNTDQGSQFTGFAFTGRLREAGIRISMDGRGRCMDNIFIERLWRSLKYEAVYLHEIADGFAARRVIGAWIGFYNTERPHSALGGRTPAEAYRGDTPVDMIDKPLRALPTSPQAQQQQQEDRFKGILAA